MSHQLILMNEFSELLIVWVDKKVVSFIVTLAMNEKI